MLDVEECMLEVVMNGYYTCSCGNYVEADGECYCGEQNPILEAGLI